MKASLADCIAEVESSNRLWEMRFEPSLYAEYQRRDDKALALIVLAIARINHCSVDTARMIAATSWGKFQILGVNLYDAHVALDMPIAVFLNSPADQVSLFVKFIHWRGILSDIDVSDPAAREAVARIYNGPGNVAAYSSALLGAYQRLSVSDQTAQPLPLS